jgi:hypothetical protein
VSIIVTLGSTSYQSRETGANVNKEFALQTTWAKTRRFRDCGTAARFFSTQHTKKGEKYTKRMQNVRKICKQSLEDHPKFLVLATLDCGPTLLTTAY